MLMGRTPNQAQGQQAQNLGVRAPAQGGGWDLQQDGGLEKGYIPKWGQQSQLLAWPGENVVGAQLWGPPGTRRYRSLCQGLRKCLQIVCFEPCLLALG